MRQKLYCFCLGVALFSNCSAQAETAFRLLVPEDVFLPVAREIASGMDHESDLKIFPVFGDGSVLAPQVMANYADIGAAILPSDILAYRTTQKLNESQPLRYISRIASLPILLVAKKSIPDISGLAGKRIATGPANSAAFATGELIMGAANISFKRVPHSGVEAIKALIAGKTDAAFILASPAALAALPQGQFHFLAISGTPQLQQIYQPALLTSADYPTLLKGDETVETVASSLIVAVPENSKSAALSTFEKELLNFERHSGETNLAAEVPGWQRASGVADLIKQPKLTIQPTGGTP